MCATKVHNKVVRILFYLLYLKFIWWKINWLRLQVCYFLKIFLFVLQPKLLIKIHETTQTHKSYLVWGLGSNPVLEVIIQRANNMEKSMKNKCRWETEKDLYCLMCTWLPDCLIICQSECMHHWATKNEKLSRMARLVQLLGN